jgi:hypothetical protein
MHLHHTHPSDRAVIHTSIMRHNRFLYDCKFLVGYGGPETQISIKTKPLQMKLLAKTWTIKAVSAQMPDEEPYLRLVLHSKRAAL